MITMTRTRLFLLFVLAALLAFMLLPVVAFGQTSGQWVLQQKNAGAGFTLRSITGVNNRAFGLDGSGNLTMLSISGGAGLTNLESAIAGGTLTLGGTLTTDRTLTVRDLAGTIALTSDLSAYLTTATAASTYVAVGGSYANPSWITSLAWSKLTSTPTTLAGYGIADALTSEEVALTYAPKANAEFTGTFSAEQFSLAPVGGGSVLLTLDALTFNNATGSVEIVPTYPLSASTYTLTLPGETGTLLTSASNLDGSKISTGTVAAARLGTGTSISTKFLRGDNTWQTISGGGDALTSGTLAQFAATTSAQLRGVLTDESGTGEFLTTNGSAANLTSFPTLNQNTTGNAATATALETARNINGTSFNGTADITIAAAAGTLTGTTLAANVVSSSLTSVGTIASGTWQGSIIAPAYLGTGTSITTKFLRGDGTWQTISGGGGGKVAQVVSTSDSTSKTTTTTIPFDNTIPQSSEGVEYTELATTITATSASSTLLIEVDLWISSGGVNSIIAAVFKDTGTDAVASGWFTNPGASYVGKLTIKHHQSAGSTSAQTFKVRWGVVTSGTIYLNNSGGTSYLGGTLNSSMRITEILP